MMKPKRILITGATGMLGRRLAGALARDGHEIVATSRDHTRAQKTLGESVQCFSWDYQRQPFPAAALQGVSAVYHLMGENIGAGRWTVRKKNTLRDSRIVSTRKLVAALTEDVTDFFSASAIGIYPGHTHRRFDEGTSLPAPDSFMTQLCCDWELAAAGAATPQRRQCALRIGLVLAESGMLATLMPIYRLGLGGPIGNGEQHLPWVHVDDLVNMMRFILQHQELNGPINLVGPEPLALEHFSNTLARIVRRPHLFRVPAVVVRALMGEASALALSSYNIWPTKLLDAGFEFDYHAHEVAIEHIVRSYY